MRYNISLSPELNDKVTRLAHEFGVSKSSFISIAVAKEVKNYDKLDEVFGGIRQLVKENLISACLTHENNAHISQPEARGEDFDIDVGTY